MAKQFDATVKQLVESHPGDWLALAGIEGSRTAEIIDADVSTVSAAADKVLRVSAPQPAIAHVEIQTGPDRSLDGRTLLYNVLLRHRHQLPVWSVVILLRPQGPSAILGGFSEVLGPENRIDFRYRLVRVWQVPAERLLSGGLGTVPLAPISALGTADLNEVVRRARQRLASETRGSELQDALTATRILMGLRYPRDLIDRLFSGETIMKESVIYQAIIEEGREEGLVEGRVKGRVEEAKEMLVRIGQRRLGKPAENVLAALAAMTDVQRIEAMGDRLMDANSWQELFDLSL